MHKQREQSIQLAASRMRRTERQACAAAGCTASSCLTANVCVRLVIMACITWHSIMPRTPVCTRAIWVHGKAVWLTFLRLPHPWPSLSPSPAAWPRRQADRHHVNSFAQQIYMLLPPVPPALCFRPVIEHSGQLRQCRLAFVCSIVRHSQQVRTSIHDEEEVMCRS